MLCMCIWFVLMFKKIIRQDLNQAEHEQNALLFSKNQKFSFLTIFYFVRHLRNLLLQANQSVKEGRKNVKTQCLSASKSEHASKVTKIIKPFLFTWVTWIKCSWVNGSLHIHYVCFCIVICDRMDLYETFFLFKNTCSNKESIFWVLW